MYVFTYEDIAYKFQAALLYVMTCIHFRHSSLA